jgi:uncharacterized protein
MNIQVTVVYSPAPRVVHEMALTVPLGTTVAQALNLSGLLTRFPEIKQTHAVVGVWGREVVPNRLLVDQDRIEIYRGLKVDPKLARRERFMKQGARTTGLFAKKRPGAKDGY